MGHVGKVIPVAMRHSYDEGDLKSKAPPGPRDAPAHILIIPTLTPNGKFSFGVDIFRNVIKRRKMKVLDLAGF